MQSLHSAERCDDNWTNARKAGSVEIYGANPFLIDSSCYFEPKLFVCSNNKVFWSANEIFQHKSVFGQEFFGRRVHLYAPQ